MSETADSLAGASADRRLFAIIPTWRKPGDAVEAVASLRSGSLIPASTIVLDNGSADGTVASLREGLKGTPDTTLIELPENLGFARAVNEGIRRALDAGATHVLLMNDDALVEPDCLERLVQALEEDTACGLAAPRILYHRSGRIWQGAGYYSRLRTGVVSTEKNRSISECSSERRRVTFATGCVLLIRRKVLEEVGLLEESLYFYEEDVEFGLRAGRGGYTTLYVPDAVAHHKIESVSRQRTSAFVLYHLARSRLIRLRLTGRAALAYGLLVHTLAYTPYRLWQIWRGSRSWSAVAAWFRGSRDGLVHELHRG